MRKSWQLPSAEMLFAFGFVYKCVVYVHFGGDRPMGYFPPELEPLSDLPRVHLQCISEIHYNHQIETSKYMSSDVDNIRARSPVAASQGDPSEHEQNDGEGEVYMGTRADVALSKRWCVDHECTHVTSTILAIRSVECCVLFDTGAQVSCISHKLVTK